MKTQLLHDLLEDHSVWSLFSRRLKAKKINSQAFPYYRNYVQHFLRRAKNTSVEELSTGRVTHYLKMIPK